MSDGTFVKELVAQTRKPTIQPVNGVQVVATPTTAELNGKFSETWRWSCGDSFPPPLPSPLGLNTLAGIVKYLTENHDGITLNETVVLVESETTVTAHGRLTQPHNQRPTYATADCASIFGNGFEFGRYVPLEHMIVSLQSLFYDAEDRAAVLAVLSAVKDGTVMQHEDDGVSQQVTGRKGVASLAKLSVPNPVMLRPYRTFREVEQPMSRFVLRLRSGQQMPEVALFEADGGAWKLTAIEKIAEYLRANLPTTVAVIA